MRRIKRISITFIILTGLLWLYSSSLIGLDQQAKEYLVQLKQELRDREMKPAFIIISGRRWKFDNYLLNKFGNASPQSRHLHGQAIDILILDVNRDGRRDAADVDIVYKILDSNVIDDNGGLGSYKNTSSFFSRQMIHFDCRGHRARWNR